MNRAMLKKEWKLVLSSYKLPFLINFLIYGIFLGSFIISMIGSLRMQILSLPKELDPFLLFSVFSIAMSSMLMMMTSPTTIAEKSLGILDNMLAYAPAPRHILVPKAVFLWGITYATFLFWSLIGIIASHLLSFPFVHDRSIGRDIVFAVVLYPALLFLIAISHVFTIYVFPQLTQLVNLLLFGFMFFILSSLAQLTGTLMSTGMLMMVTVSLAICAVIGLFIAFLGKLDSETIVKST